MNSNWTSRSLLSLLLSLFFLWPILTNGQDTTEVEKPPAPRIEGGSGQIASTNSEFVMTKSPTTALLWAIIPSGGQVYTEQYWKVPVFLVPIGALVGLGIYNNGRASDYNDQLQTLTKGSLDYNATLANREQFRDNRDLSWAIAGGIYLLSFVDAYVGAHLFDFDVGDSLSSIEIYPDFEHNGVGISARW
ncbi:MAG: DUF5683 domain-containing protein [Candidatus Kapaibacterium sp.]